MYTYIKGILIESASTYTIVETGGLGFHIHTPLYMASLFHPGTEVKFFTSFIIRENSQALYGFQSAKERDFFELLLTVSGIGPKIALNAIGALSHEELCQAIMTKDIQHLCKVPGIGKKMAERLVMELKDKLPSLYEPRPSSYQIDPLQDDKTKDALSALINLGYTQLSAQKALKKSFELLPETADLSEVIMAALKNI